LGRIIAAIASLEEKDCGLGISDEGIGVGVGKKKPEPGGGDSLCKNNAFPQVGRLGCK